MQSFTFSWSPDLGAAIIEAQQPDGLYAMHLVYDDGLTVEAAVNQGIDSHLEACFIPDRGDSYEWANGRLDCSVSAESLAVLVRRLLANGPSGRAADLASAICGTLDIELI